MKKFFLPSFLFLLFLNVQATVIDIDVADFAFTPDTVVAVVGDTLIWTLSGGSHTTTSTVVPAGAASWDYTFSGVGDAYTYIISVPGDYTYICSIHTEMVGTIRVADVLPLIEDFDYTAGLNLTDVSQWWNHSGTGTFLTIQSGSLAYTDYPSSGIGNSTLVAGGSGSREDVNRIFEPQSSSVYASVLVNVQSAGTTADYFLNLSPLYPTTTFRGRVFVVDDGSGNLKFGISKGSSTVAYAAGNYSYNTTYLLVLKYEVVTDVTGNDDVVKLFINPDMSASEPAADATNSDSPYSDITAAGVALRQGGNSYSLQVDGLRVSTSWSDIVPVELTSFAASVTGKAVTLNWATATELNNLGFEVQRSSDNISWNAIAFLEGKGTTTAEQNYSYIDNSVSTGKYLYRLKQVDFNGSFEFSSTVEIQIGVPDKFILEQNYPNPFNPNTTIKFVFDKNTKAEIKVYDVLGNEVASLFNGIVEAGRIYEADFNASGLSSGVYYYKLSGDGRTAIKKMLLLK